MCGITGPHPLPEPTHHQAPPGQRSDEIRVRNGTELERQRSIAEERIDGATADHEVIHPSTPALLGTRCSMLATSSGIGCPQ